MASPGVTVRPVGAAGGAAPAVGVPVPCTQPLSPAAPFVRTRTRYAVAARPVMDCDAVVPLRETATHPAAGSVLPPASASLPTLVEEV